MENFQIIKALSGDIFKLQNIGRTTFCETFAETNTEQDMVMYIEENFSDQKLTEELNNPESEFYFAILDNIIIGYLKINFGHSQTELSHAHAVEIERIYILRDYQGIKAGQLLFDKAVQIAKLRNAPYIWLGVWEKNSKALHFYKKNGFIEFDKHIFKLGNDHQTDLMMKFYL